MMKDWIISPEDWKQVKDICFYHTYSSQESTSQHSKAKKKGNKRNTDWKKRNKTVPFADGIVVYIENARNVFFKTLETVHEFSKVTAYKVNA